MAGYFTPTGVWDNDATLFTTDAAGAVQWAMRYGSHGYESFNAVEPGTNGGFLAGGTGELDSLSQERGGLPSSSYLVMTNANGQTFGCEDPLSISSSSANFFDLTYLQTVTDVAGWANAAMVTSTGYEEVAACPALGVNDVQRPALGLYPNPASDQLTLTSGTALRSIEVHAADGRLVSRQRMVGTWTLDIRALAPGAYVLRALDAQGHVLRGRFMKE